MESFLGKEVKKWKEDRRKGIEPPDCSGSSINHLDIWCRPSKRNSETEFLIWRVSRDRLDGRQKRIRERNERAARWISRIVCVSMDTPRLSIPSRFFGVIFGDKYYRVEQCDRLHWMLQLRWRSRTVGNLRHCFSEACPRPYWNC